MSYKEYVSKFKDHLTNWGSFASGKGSCQNFDAKIDTTQELHALRNAVSAEQLIHLSNAYYDQVAIGRSIKELYKTPKDYFAQFEAANKAASNEAEAFGAEVESQHTQVKASIESAQAARNLSPDWQLKLSKIRSEFDDA